MSNLSYWRHTCVHKNKIFEFTNGKNIIDDKTYIPDVWSDWEQVSEHDYLIQEDKYPVGRYLKVLVDNPQGIPVNIGDIIQIKSNNRCKIINSRYDCYFSFNISRKDQYELLPPEFAPTVEKTTTKTPKFKVGDKVKAIDQTDDWSTVKKGDVGVIVQCIGDRYYADFPSFDNWVGKEHCFELVEEDTSDVIPEYVECIKDTLNKNQLNKIYKVNSYNSTTGSLQINFDGKNKEIINIFFGEKSKIKFNNTDFKPSTKEAYDKQNSATTQELPKNWYFKVAQENYKKFKHLRELSNPVGYISSIGYGKLSWGYYHKFAPEAYTEIPFELFEKHYLNKEVKTGSAVYLGTSGDVSKINIVKDLFLNSEDDITIPCPPGKKCIDGPCVDDTDSVEINIPKIEEKEIQLDYTIKKTTVLVIPDFKEQPEIIKPITLSNFTLTI